MNNNPGLLPLKIGNAQTVIDHWSFVQIYDISNVIEEFSTLQNYYLRFKNALENSTHDPHYAREFYNSYHLVDTLENKILIQIHQLNPLNNKRNKRGLIDGLGSIIKSITGNLDQADAEKYDQAINTLSNSQIKIKTLMKEQITLLQTSIQKFRNTTETLAHNQLTLVSRIMQLEQVFQTTKLMNMETYHYFLTQMIISQITTAFQIIYDIFERIEVAITFSKLNTFHNSIIEPVDLLSEILSVTNQLNENKFPFVPNLENILLFEKIIEIKSYSKGNQIVFILEIPVVESDNYNYYHLYSLPTPFSKSFKAIVPPSKYLLLNEHSYAFTDARCQEVIFEEFLCQEINPAKIKDNVPCEIQMLKYAQNISNCQQMPIELMETRIQKTEKNQWIVITPRTAVALQICGRNKDNIPLNGTYLLELNNQCEVQINGVSIKTLQNSKRNFKKIELPKIDFSEDTREKDSDFNFKPLEIEHVNLDEIKNIQSALDIQNQKLNEINEPPILGINVHNVILYILIVLIIAFVLYVYFIHKIKLCRSKSTAEASPAQPPNIRPSNFVVNPQVLK